MRKFKYFKYQSIALICITVLLSGCATELSNIKSVNKDVKKYDKKVASAYKTITKKKKKAKQLQILNEYYIVKSKRVPFWLQSEITINGSFSLSTLMKQILQDTGGTIQIQRGANPNKLITFNFTGSIKQALSRITDKTGYEININGNNIEISDIVSRTYQIHTIPGKSDYTVGKTASQHSIGSIETMGASSSSSSSDQFSKESGSINPWKDVKSAITSMISSQGKFHISQSTSSISVSDHAKNIKYITNWIKMFNANLKSQVSFKVQLISVKLNNSFERGINWDAFFGSYKMIKPDLLSGVLQVSGVTAGASAANTAFTLMKGGNKYVINFLSKQGKIVDVNEPVLTTLNNRMAQLREVRTIAYLQKISTSTIPIGTSASQQKTMTPNAITTGLELYIIPHIENNKVFMKISISMANLDAMNTIGDLSTGEGIELPVVSITRFNQDASLTNGQTLVIGGFKYNHNSYGDSKNFNLSALGAFSSLKSNTELVLLITPYLSHNNR